MKKIKFGFTLAEVLIAMGVVGVIAALTIPNLMNDYQKKSLAAAAHKFYSQTEDALGSYLAEHNADSLYEAGMSSGAGVVNFFKDNFKITTDCGTSKTPCFASTYTSIDGTSTVDITPANYACTYVFTLPSGTSVCTSSGLPYSYSENGITKRYGFVYFDVNGPKPPNIAGRDYFLAYMWDDGSLEGTSTVKPSCRKYNTAAACAPYASASAARAASVCTNNSWPGGCLGKLQENNWEMNY